MAKSSCDNVFQRARDDVEEEITQYIRCLNETKIELFGEINSLESRFNNKQKQKQSHLEKLNALKSHAEDLGENSLIDVQQKILTNLETEISNLKLHSSPPTEIKIKWGLSRFYFTSKIKSSHIVQVNIVNNEEDLNPVVNLSDQNVRDEMHQFRESDWNIQSSEDWKIPPKVSYNDPVDENKWENNDWSAPTWEENPTPRAERVYSVENSRKERREISERKWRDNLGEKKQVYVVHNARTKKPAVKHYNANNQPSKEANVIFKPTTAQGNSSPETNEKEDCNWDPWD